MTDNQQQDPACYNRMNTQSRRFIIKSLVNREPSYQFGVFFVGVKTTRFFVLRRCRGAKNQNVKTYYFIVIFKDAMNAGFRPVKVLGGPTRECALKRLMK